MAELGIPECQRMVDRERDCFTKTVQGTARQQVLEAIASMDKALRDAVKTGGADFHATMNDSCRQANQALDPTMVQMGCQ